MAQVPGDQVMEESFWLNANHAFFARLSVVRQIDWPDQWQQKPKNIQTHVYQKLGQTHFHSSYLKNPYQPIMGDTLLYFGINASP